MTIYLPEDTLKPIIRYLRNDPVFIEMASTIPEGAVNPLLGPPVSVPRSGMWVPYEASEAMWIQRPSSDFGAPNANVEGTGTSAITIRHTRDWSRGQKGSAKSFPEITVNYFCDPTRDATTGGPLRFDARDKLISMHLRMQRLFDATFFDRTDNSFFLMGPDEHGENGLRVIDSSPGQPLSISFNPEVDGMAIGTATFELEILNRKPII